MSPGLVSRRIAAVCVAVGVVLSAVPVAVAAPPAAVSAGELQLLTATDTGGLFHALRRSNGSWTGAGDVKAVLGDPGLVVDTASATVGDELHVVLVTETGGVFHAVRYATGRWSVLGDVKGQTGDPGLATKVAAANVGGNLHVVVGTGNLIDMYHTVRFAGGSWTGFGYVNYETGNAGYVFDVGLAGVGDQLHLVTASDRGGVYHAIRFADGAWADFAGLGNAGRAGRIAAATVALRELHVVVRNSEGALLHAVRSSGGSWTGFGDVKVVAGDPGEVLDVAAAGVSGGSGGSGGLQLVVSTQDGGLFHTVRSGNGSWFGFGNVKAVIGDPGSARAVAVAG